MRMRKAVAAAALMVLTTSADAAVFLFSYVEGQRDRDQFVSGTTGFSIGRDLGSVSTTDVGPAGQRSAFENVGDTVSVFGSVETDTDTYQVDFDRGLVGFFRVLKLDPAMPDLEITFDSASGTETFDVTSAGAVGAFSGLTRFEIDNMDTNSVAYDVALVATPIPGALLLLGTGIAGLAGYRFRRANKPSA